MDLRKLHIFTVVARCQSFSAAARELHMAQPAVSIAVRKLEQSLDIMLFDRSSRQIQLTSEGDELRRRAETILLQIEQLKHDCSARRDLLQGELTVSCPSMLATYHLPRLLGDFLREHPGLRASVNQFGTTRIRQQLLQDELELGVISEHNESQELNALEQVPLITQPIVLCVACDHPWAQREQVAIGELQDSPMVVYESGYFIRDRLDELCKAQGVMPDLRMQTNFLPLLIRMVKQGLGSTIGLEIMAAEEPGIVAVPLAGDATISMALAKRRGRTISRANQAFLDWAAFKL